MKRTYDVLTAASASVFYHSVYRMVREHLAIQSTDSASLNFESFFDFLEFGPRQCGIDVWDLGPGP